MSQSKDDGSSGSGSGNAPTNTNKPNVPVPPAPAGSQGGKIHTHSDDSPRVIRVTEDVGSE